MPGLRAKRQPLIAEGAAEQQFERVCFMASTLVIDGVQLKRLMAICRLVSSHTGLTARQLQTKLKTSRRTVFRDLRALHAMGVKIAPTADGYRLKQDIGTCRKLVADSLNKALRTMLAKYLA